MPKKIKDSISQSQMKSRPKIEDVIGNVISDEKLELALGFIAYLKEKKLTISWASANTWSIKYKGQRLLVIRLTGAEFYTFRNIEDGSWLIDPPFDMNNEYNDIKGSFKEAIWENINYCVGCIKCKPGHTRVVLGKTFENVCGHLIVFINPDADDLTHIKQMLEIAMIKAEQHGTVRLPLLDAATEGLVRIDNALRVCGVANENMGALFDGKYTKYYYVGPYGTFKTDNSTHDVLFQLDEPVQLSMYSLVSDRTDAIPSAWTLYGRVSENAEWVQLDARKNEGEKPTTHYTEKAFCITTPGIFQLYKVTFEGKSFLLSQVHLYI